MAKPDRLSLGLKPLLDSGMLLTSVLILILLALNPAASSSPVDSDRDGLTDRFEQELLQKFAPRLMLSSKECDGLPARFRPGLAEPRILSKDGTVYGQVFRADARGGSGVFIELHYYHLWNRDCGRIGHALDSEHVSALVWADSASEPATGWKAKYWYAAAHEGTSCDASHGIRSSLIGAEDRGTAVWISAGKHASFLAQELCRGGCGVDNCSDMHPSPAYEIVNLGEIHAPMNGASWVEWPAWPLAAKMQTDFPASILAKLDAAPLPGFVSINEAQPPLKTALHVGGDAAGAPITAARTTGSGLATTTDAVGTSVEKSSSGTGVAFKRAARAVWKALGGSKKQD